MRKIIKGKLYDTDTAECIGSTDDGGLNYNDMYYWSEDLYRKKTGEFFLFYDSGSFVCNIWGRGDSITPLSMAEAKEWAEQYLSADAYISAFGEVDE